MAISANAQRIIDRINELKAGTHTQADIDAAVVEAKGAAAASAAAQETEDLNGINAALDASPVTPNADGTPAVEPSRVQPEAS